MEEERWSAEQRRKEKKERGERREKKERNGGGIGKETNSESYSDSVYSRSSRRSA